MTAEQSEQIEQLFHAALEMEPAARANFLQQACGADEELRRAVERLLQSHERGAGFLDAPVWAVAPSQVVAAPSVLERRWLGHYELLSLLGKGGMGEVYLARDERLERQVALKLLPAEFLSDAERVRRFAREAKAASALNHPNILTIYEIGQTADAHFIATEFIAGRTLRAQLHEAPCDGRTVLDWGVQIASALAAAHEAGIVHRDLKPENLMVRRDGIVKVLDFGLAKLTEERRGDAGTRGRGEEDDLVTASPRRRVSASLTDPGTVMGTASYMSPEQARGQEVDARSDIFSFGVVLYELLAGRPPFAGASVSDVIAEILKTEPTPLIAVAPDVPRELAGIVNRALRKDRAERYQDGAELFAELKILQRQFDSGQLSARPTAPLLSRVSIKRPRRVALIALAALLVTSIAAFFYFNRRSVLTARDTILLADFANTTGEAVFDGTLRQALAVQLEQTPFLNLFSDEQVRVTLRLMERQPEERVTREVALEICRRRGLKAALIGAIAKLDRRYAIALEAIDGRSGETISRTLAEADGKDGVLRALETATTELRRKLGESLASVQQFNAPLEEATTKSLEALQSFSLGMEQGRIGNQLAAIPHFRRAIELDPDFALAYARLANAYGATLQPALSAQAAEQAHRRRAQASEREKLAIMMIYYSNATREPEKWFETLKLVAQTYPREAAPHSQMAFYYNQRGQPERALAAAREAVRLSGGDIAGFYIPIATALIRLNRFDEAQEAIRQAQARQHDVIGYRLRLFQIGFVRGDAALLQEQLDWMRGREDEHLASEWQSQTAAFAGRLRAAQDYSRRAVEMARQRNLPEVATGLALEAALRQALVGNEQVAKDNLSQALVPLLFSRGGRDNSVLPAGPLALALSGELRQAQLLLEEVARRTPNNPLLQAVGLPTVRAVIALRNHRPDQAVALLEPARAYEIGAQFWPTYLRGCAYLDLRRGAEAAAEFEKIIDHRGWDPTSLIWPLAHLGLAQAAALTGESAKSQAARQTFSALWSEADADLPILRTAHPAAR